MMKRLKDILLCVLLTTLVGFILWNRGKVLQAGHKDGTTVPDTVRVVVYDTLTYYQPIPVDSTVIHHITEKLPVSENREEADDDPDTSAGHKTDSVEVQIPVTRKIYEDSTYRAVISGYRINLEEMTVYPRREIVIVNNRPKPKRWSVGIQAGYGITPSAGLHPYLGVGLTYNIFNF